MLHLGKSFKAWEGGVNCSRFIKVFFFFFFLFFFLYWGRGHVILVLSIL